MNSQYLYSESPVPRLSSQPFKVFSTPGLGNFFNDHSLYTHVRYFEPNVKEVEKNIEPDNSEGGFELNSPLIPQPLVLTKKKKTKKRKSQKGHVSEPTDKAIDEAFDHPIKVV